MVRRLLALLGGPTVVGSCAVPAPSPTPVWRRISGTHRPQATPHKTLPRGLYHRIRQSLIWRLKRKTSLALADVFNHYAVLQRDMPVAIWGTTDPFEYVEVEFDDQVVSCRADNKGNWRVTLAPMPADSRGRKLYVRTFFRMVTLHYVMVGEVWLCSGQSNMGWTVELSSDAERHLARSRNPQIRMLPVHPRRASSPCTHLEVVRWEESHPECTCHWSAVGYHFARTLHEELGVPVGILWSSLGATKIQEWTSLETNALHDYCVPEEWNSNEASSLFNGMIAPLIPYTIRGVAWYQGEENHWGAGVYRAQQCALIEDWRERWGQGSFPFLFVQLANYGEPTREPWSAWAELQEAQLKSLSHPNTAMAVSIDVGCSNDIHPPQKEIVGRRLAIAALGKVYGRSIEWSGPIYRGYRIEEGGRVRIFFEHTGGGLETTDGGPLRCFELGTLEGTSAGEIRYFMADAVIEDQTVVVWNPDVASPCAVRYAYSNNPAGCNLRNRDGLPASPFRTHNDWSVTLGNAADRPHVTTPVAVHVRERVIGHGALRIPLDVHLHESIGRSEARIEIVEKPAKGSVTAEGMALTYLRDPRCSGADRVRYRVCARGMTSNLASVILELG